MWFLCDEISGSCSVQAYFKQHLGILQNIQDCRTSLDTESPQDLLEQDTIEPPELANVDTSVKKDGLSDAELDNLLQQETANLAALFDSQNQSQEHDKTEQDCNSPLLHDINLDNLANIGTKGCGSSSIRSSSCDIDKVLVSSHLVDEDEETTDNEEVPSNSSIRVLNCPLVTRNMLNTVRSRWVRQRVSCLNDEDNVGISPPTGSISSLREWGAAQFGDDAQQRRAFEVIVSSFLLMFYDEAQQQPEDDAGNDTNEFIASMAELREMQGLRDPNQSQLIMFLTGPAGAGKSRVFKALRSYAMGFCERLGYPFTRHTIVVTATSGTAAADIHGSTVHSAISYFWAVQQNAIDDFKATRLFILDEISLADCSDIRIISQKLGELMERPASKYGGVHIVFSGDFRQLEKPKTRAPLYRATNFHQWHGWMNSFIRLQGLHRFSDDGLWGGIMQRFHEGAPTEEDFDVIDSRVVGGDRGLVIHDIPATCHYAVMRNVDRCAINKMVSFVNTWRTPMQKTPMVLLNTPLSFLPPEFLGTRSIVRCCCHVLRWQPSFRTAVTATAKQRTSRTRMPLPCSWYTITVP